MDAELARSTGADVQFADVAAAGELADSLHYDLAMNEELVADDGVSGEHGLASARIDLVGVRIMCVGRADEFRPLLADGLLRGFATDLKLGH